MKKIDHEIMDKFKKITFVDYPDCKIISDDSSKASLEFIRNEVPFELKKQFYFGLFYEIKKYKKRQRKIKKVSK